MPNHPFSGQAFWVKSGHKLKVCIQSVCFTQVIIRGSRIASIKFVPLVGFTIIST